MREFIWLTRPGSAMDTRIHLAGAVRQRDGYPNPHLFSAMDSGIHRGVKSPGRDGSGNSSQECRMPYGLRLVALTFNQTLAALIAGFEAAWAFEI